MDSHGEVDEWDFTEFAVSEYEEDDDEVRASARHLPFEALGKLGARRTKSSQQRSIHAGR